MEESRGRRRKKWKESRRKMVRGKVVDESPEKDWGGIMQEVRETERKVWRGEKRREGGTVLYVLKRRTSHVEYSLSSARLATTPPSHPLPSPHYSHAGGGIGDL